MKTLFAALAAFVAFAFGSTFAAAQQSGLGWSEQSAAAAMGYCLARHPYIPGDDGWTAEGFETLKSPGILGAIRRNYVFERTPGSFPGNDEGNGQTCNQACGQWGRQLNSGAVPLRYRNSNGDITNNGIGDMASTVIFDSDFYLQQPGVVVGMIARPLTYHEADVAQADFCCCQYDASAAPAEKKRGARLPKVRLPKQPAD
jgi:hypothetical protein